MSPGGYKKSIEVIPFRAGISEDGTNVRPDFPFQYDLGYGAGKTAEG